MFTEPSGVSYERKVPVIVRKAYTVSLERTNNLTLIHCDIHQRWSPKIKDALMDDWRNFRRLHDAPILALHRPDDEKHYKFLIMFGFRFIGSFEDAETGADTHLFIHKRA